MTNIKKISDHPYAQARILTDDEGVYLRSYNTLVCGVQNGYAFCNGTFSATTIKHIGWFAKACDCGLSYYDFKRMYRENLLYHIDSGLWVNRDTGEVVE